MKRRNSRTDTQTEAPKEFTIYLFFPKSLFWNDAELHHPQLTEETRVLLGGRHVHTLTLHTAIEHKA